MLNFFKIIFAISLLAVSFIFFSVFAAQSFAMDCSNCSPGACVCYISECPTGTLSVYSTNCTGIPKKEFIFSNSTFVWTSALAQNYYFKAYCDNGNSSSCTKVNLTTSVTTTTTTTTTTTPSLSSCLYDCCIDQPGFYNKYCNPGYDCVNSQCVAQTSTATPSQGFQINYSLVGIVVIIVVFAVFIYYFLKGRAKKPEDKWSKLYKKYGRR